MKFSQIARSVLLTGVFLSIAGFSSASYALCKECGKVTSLKTVKVKGEGTGAGVVAGGILGGVLGHQVGGGRGKDVATVAGAAGGAYVGHQAEKEIKSTIKYQVHVKMEDGVSRTFTFAAPTNYQVGDKIKISDGKLTRR